MPLYELVFIVRPDLSSTDLDQYIEEFSSIITSAGGKILKNEYWGLRSLAYEINHNRKGHYVFLGVEAPYEAIKEIDRKVKIKKEDIIRFVFIGVDHISDEPSPILQAADTDNKDVIDVTI